MRTAKQWFDEYSESHQNRTNQKIHFICVPLIYFSIIGLFYSIPNSILLETLELKILFIENWAFFMSLFVMLFYLRLNLKIYLRMFIFNAFCILVCMAISQFYSVFYISLTIFILAWIGQFYGHNLEGKKPSFLKDLQFLLIGPAWVFQKIFH
jgi:uncharacterized membrane protein YGL010W